MGIWVGRQRNAYKNGDLPAERIKALEEVPGWIWDSHEAHNLTGLERLRAYADREGHAMVPLAYKDETGFWLGNWIRSQRITYKKGELLPERIKALEEVPGWVWEAQSRGT